MLLEFVRKFVRDTFMGLSEHPARREAVDAREAMDREKPPVRQRLPAAFGRFKLQEGARVKHLSRQWGGGSSAAREWNQSSVSILSNRPTQSEDYLF